MASGSCWHSSRRRQGSSHVVDEGTSEHGRDGLVLRAVEPPCEGPNDGSTSLGSHRRGERMSARERIERSEGRRLFGLDPEGYDAARPRYPTALFDAMRAAGVFARGRSTLEIGAGSGLATKPLLELGADPLTVIEPDRRFHDMLGRLVKASDAQCTIDSRAFEDFVSTERFDLVVVATAFHWLEPVSALRKIATLLVPGGRVALLWNVLQVIGMRDAFHEATQSLLANQTTSPSGEPGAVPYALDRAALEADLARAGAFNVPEYHEIRWTHVLDTRGVGQLYEGFSHIQRLGEDERKALLERLMDIADREFGGRVERNVTSVLYLASAAFS